MYFVGIDFGHGETIASRVPGYNGTPVSQISIRQANNNEGKKILSAICRKKGQWSLVYGEQDFKLEDVREGFKDRISKMTEKDKESMREFAKLIFKAILENDTDLKYDPTSEEKNFELGIACPSDWIREDLNAQQEYLDFFRNECGLPVDHCIKESDAAFFSKYNRYEGSDNVFVIDIGSSTIDFTTYANSRCIADCCWGKNLGAHRIEDALIPRILKAEDNAINLQKLKEFRNYMKFEGDVNAPLSLHVRLQKELYFSNKQETYSLDLAFKQLTPSWPGKSWDHCIGFEATKDKFEEIISNYTSQIGETLRNAKTKLSQNGITPNRVLLSGGASRMPFIKEYAHKIFGVDIDVDQQPECVVSNGIALYVQKFDEAFNKLLNNLKNVNFESIYKKADSDATADAIKELVPSVVSRIKNYSNCTGDRMRTMFCDFIKGLDENNITFKNLVLSKLKSTLNSEASKAIAEAYKSVFKLDIDARDINIDIQANILSFSPENFQPGGAWYNCFTVWIDSSSGRYDFTWDKSRDYEERCKIANGVMSSLTSHVSSNFISYGNIDTIVENIVRQVVYHTIEIFKKKQLFEMTFKQ